MGKLTQSTLPPRTDTGNIPLTERQLDVLRLVANGATNKEIALQLDISEGTVKNYISTILSELNLRDRTQAAIFAHRHGLLES